MDTDDGSLSRTRVLLPDGRCVGVHDGTTFFRTLRDEHLLRHPPAIAVRVEVLRWLVSEGVSRAVFDFPDRGVTYSGSIALFWSRGHVLDRGHGRQRYVVLSHWFQTSTAQPTLPGDWAAAFTDGAGVP